MISPLKTPSGEPIPVAPTTHATTCPHCKSLNNTECVFCTQCGGNLQAECPYCKKKVRVGVPYCGSCGKQIFDPENEQKQQLQKAFDNAKTLCQNGYFEEAAQILKDLDVTSEHYRNQVSEEIAKTYDGYRKGFQIAGEHYEKAQAAFEEKQYDIALEELEQVLPGLRNAPITELLAEVRKTRDEIKLLETRLDPRTALAKPIEALADAKRLLELVPQHATAKTLSQKIISRLCDIANKRIETLKYQAAKDLLQIIPVDLRDERALQLLHRSSELSYLVRDLSTAAIMDPTLLALAQRWAKIAPHDKRVVPFVSKIKERLAQQHQQPELTMQPWTKSPDLPYVGHPIQWVQNFKNIAREKESLPREFIECPAMFCTAIGLALQGLEKSACTLNWYDAPLPGSDTKKILLQKMGHWIARNNRSPRDMQAAWGIDLGSRCLKAVRLQWKTNETRPTITDAVYLPYDHALDLNKDPAIEADCLISVLKKFAEQTKPKRERIAVNLSGKHLLCRTLTLPPMEASQVHGALAREAKQRFHFSQEELAWDYHVLRKETIDKREVEETVLLAGVRRAYIAQRLAMFAEVKLRVDVIQSDAIAMYNFLMHEAFNEPQTKTIACLDIGYDKTNLLILGSEGVLHISSLAFGIRQFNRTFRETFHLEHEEAEHLIWHPEMAADLRRFFETTNEMLENFVQKTSRTLQPYDGSPWKEPADQIYLTGGGIRFHGLLSYLRHGPSPSTAVAPTRSAQDN